MNTHIQTKNNQEAIIVLGNVVGTVIYAAWRTAYLVKVLAPIWGHRIIRITKLLYAQTAQDVYVARKVYGGTNIRMVTMDEPKTEVTNNYHLRYEGTDREAE